MRKLNAEEDEIRQKCTELEAHTIGRLAIWYYLGLTLSLKSFKFFEISSKRQATFNFHQNKSIFNQQILFSPNLLFSLYKKVLQYKMTQKTNSILIITIIDVMADKKNS